MSAAQPIVMLVVEDNPADVLFFNEAIEASHTPALVHVVWNGDDAMRFLRRTPPFGTAPQPDVMVLDLNLPIKTGKEVLAEMAADPALQRIPVAILTTSSSERFLCNSYPKGRCIYFTKTDEFSRLQEIVGEIADHAWTSKEK
jgi:CheY-like chemotaxis protein